MAASSPYQQNDYNALSQYRPFNLPINEIAKTSMALDEYWKAGARRVKSVYDNALNLDLTLDANKEVKKKFMEDADKQLTKLSSMDLSDPSVQRQGFGIFKPLFQDEAIMYDNELTKTGKSIAQEADEYKQKKLSTTGRVGEGYSDRNLAYSMDGFEKFRRDLPRDVNTLKALYGELGNRKYSPFYDATTEYSKILKECKGSSQTSQDVATNYMYFDASSKTGANSSETSNCFMMGLSDKAKDQMGIDGWAYYKSDPNALLQDHQNYAYGNLARQADGVKGKIAGMQSKKNLSPQEQAYLQQMKDALPDIQDAAQKRKKEYENMVGPDALSYTTQNLRTLSKGIYLNKIYPQLGEAFRSDETTHKLTANAAGIAQFNSIEKMYQQEREHNYKMDEIKLRGSLSTKLAKAKGEIVDINQVFNPVAQEGDFTDHNWAKEFNDQHEIAYDNLSSRYKTLIDYIAEKYPNDSDGQQMGHEFILNFANQHEQAKTDPQYMELYNAYAASKDEFSELDMRKKAVEASVQMNMSKEDIKKLDETVQLSNGAVVKASDIPNIVSTTEDPNANPFITNVAPSHIKSFKVHGQTIASGTDYEKLSRLETKFSDVLQSGDKTRNELFKNYYYSTNPYTPPRYDIKKQPKLEQAVQSVSGISGEEGKKGGWKYIGQDATGKDLYYTPLDGDGKEKKITEKSDEFKNAHNNNRDVVLKRVGSRNVIVLPNFFQEAFEGTPDPTQTHDMDKLRSFKTLMEYNLRSKTGYASSDGLKSQDGSSYPYTNMTINTPAGKPIMVKAAKMGNEVKLIASTERDDKSWKSDYPSFSTPEELITYFNIYYNKK